MKDAEHGIGDAVVFTIFLLVFGLCMEWRWLLVSVGLFWLSFGGFYLICRNAPELDEHERPIGKKEKQAQ